MPASRVWQPLAINGGDLRHDHERQRLHVVRQSGTSGSAGDREPLQGFRPSGDDHAVANDPKIVNVARYLTFSPWFYLGYNGSAFQSGGAGQVGPGTNGAITDGMTRNRWGAFLATKDSSICDFRNGGRCRFTAGLEYAQRSDQSDNGGNTVASPRVVHDSTGRVFDGFLFIRPLEVFDTKTHSPFSIVGRYDHFTPQTDPSSSIPGAANYAGTTPAYNFVLLGASWDLNQRMTLTADYQHTSPTDFPAPTGTNVRPTPESTTFFLHFVVNF